MRKSKFVLLCFVLVELILLFSCGVDKRLYRKGYHIHSAKMMAPEKPKANSIRAESLLQQSTYKAREPVYATADSLMEENIFNLDNSPSWKQLEHLQECDIIVLRTGEEIKAEVLEIGVAEIKYKKCDFLDGPTRIVPKYDVQKIIYRNGSVENFVLIEKKESSSSRENEVAEKNSGGMAIASMILGILSLFTLYASVVLAILGVIFGTIAKNREYENVGAVNMGNYTMAKVGIVLSIISMVLYTLVLTFLVLL